MRTRWIVVPLLLLLTSPAVARVWQDRSGEQQIEAEFVSFDGEIARFRLPDGEIRRCGVKELSDADQMLVAELALNNASQPNVALLAAVARATQVPAINVSLTTSVAATKESANKPAVKQTLTSAATKSEPCAPAPCAPAAGTYECTVMVPQMTTEMRKITVCEWRSEERQHTYTECKMVPETRQVTYEYTVPTYEKRTREYAYTVMKPVTTTQERKYTVMVPHTEARQATRRECHMVPVEQTRTVCEDHGSFQQVVRKATGCGCCCTPCETVCNVWVPKIEKREVKYTVMRPETREVPYEYKVTVCKPEERVKQVQVCNYVPEQQKRTVPYTVCVPVTKTGTREVTDYRRVEEQKTRTYTVRVPHQVQKEVPVQVCRMVATKVTRPIPSCAPCGVSYGCGSRCGGCR